MSVRREISPEDIFIQRLDGPPEQGFDCGTTEQNSYLYDHAWADQEESVSVTYLHYVHGILAGYSTISMDGVQLSFRERGIRIRYETVGAVKLAQLGVDRAFQGCGLGSLLVDFVVAQARVVSTIVACRYVSVDARPGLEAWYERYGFRRNKLMQERMRRFALEKNRDPDRLATSMRIDIRSIN
ncbi:MAG TPA: GNAT family N-acetyltransferase [Longimicrobium sp.]